jgi:rhodanese-related sulfurtransferase
MLKKLIIKDLVGLGLLLTTCLLVSQAVNRLRTSPLPFVYSRSTAGWTQTVPGLGTLKTVPIATDRYIQLAEMKKLVSDRGCLILDARPAPFYQRSHIPSAYSLPRAEFEIRFRSLKSLLDANHDKMMVVYCSGTDCGDSEMVAENLQALGYPNVWLFRAGWNDWKSAGMPVEKGEANDDEM